MIRKRSRFPAFIGPAAGGLVAGAALVWIMTSHAPAVISASRAPTIGAELQSGADAVADLRKKHLLIPIETVSRSALRDSFRDARNAGRQHDALDILAPRNTPVRAVEDGTIAKLFLSKLGGITIYQFDPTGTYAYYYAHLERYAPGLREGQAVSRGQVIGYVGTSGNAPPETPHLHFAIFKLTPEKHWWQGTAIDPYDVLR